MVGRVCRKWRILRAAPLHPPQPVSQDANLSPILTFSSRNAPRTAAVAAFRAPIPPCVTVRWRERLRVPQEASLCLWGGGKQVEERFAGPAYMHATECGKPNPSHIPHNPAHRATGSPSSGAFPATEQTLRTRSGRPGQRPSDWATCAREGGPWPSGQPRRAQLSLDEACAPCCGHQSHGGVLSPTRQGCARGDLCCEGSTVQSRRSRRLCPVRHCALTSSSQCLHVVAPHRFVGFLHGAEWEKQGRLLQALNKH